jgi:hypothetical protein
VLLSVGLAAGAEGLASTLTAPIVLHAGTMRSVQRLGANEPDVGIVRPSPIGRRTSCRWMMSRRRCRHLTLD